MTKGWQYYLGVCFLVYSFVPMLSMAALPFLGLPLAESGLFAVAYLATGEASFWIAAALLGKELIAVLKTRAFSLFKRSSAINPVSRFRHRLGITMLLLSFLPYYVTVIYLAAFEHQEAIIEILTWSMIGGELICYAGFFVLGGLFWERFKSLFSWSKVNDIQGEVVT